MTKTHKLPKNIFFAFFATIMLAISCLLASCGGPSEPPATMYDVTWEISDKATVAVTGYDSLPAQVAEDTTLVFTVACADNYEVASVKSNNKKVTLGKDGGYSVKITKATTISVQTGKIITGIEVTKNPTKLTYFAGDALDETGMEVKVNYATGDSEVITKGAGGYQVQPSIFEGGETSFKVIYDNYEATVNLTGRVEYLVTIDPAGGTISDSWLGSIESLGLANYNVATNGVVTFSYYNNLPHAINLPTESEISRPDFTFMGWSNASSITNATAATFSTTASWQAELVVVHSASIIEEDGHPYLVVEGQFKVANEVYLYLYEGNANISFKGDTYINTSGENGASFEVKFDLNKLVEATTEDGLSYEGKWMDIRFNAKLGEREESMELFVGEGSNIQVDLKQKVFASGYAFLFATYEDLLKVYYSTVDYYYTVAQQGDHILIKGSAIKYLGATLSLTAWANANIEIGESVIDATTGEFEILVEISALPQDTNIYLHVTITGADGTVHVGEAETNFAIASCTNQAEMVKLPSGLGQLENGIKMRDSKGIAAYVGYTWDGLMMYVVNEALTYDLAAIELIEGNVYYVFSGKAIGFEQGELAFGMQFQHNNNIDGAGWEYEYNGVDNGELFTAKITGETYRVEIPVEEIMSSKWDGSVSMWAFSVKIIIDGEVKDFKPAGVSKDYAVKSGVKYSIRQDSATWSMAALVMETTDEADGSYTAATYTYDSATITNVNDRAILTVSGTYEGIDPAKLANLYYFDFQLVGGSWTRTNPELAITAADGVWTITIDVTDVEASSYVCHACVGSTEGANTNLSFKEAFTETIVIGSKSYTILSVPGSSQQSEFWGALGLTVTQA